MSAGRRAADRSLVQSLYESGFSSGIAMRTCRPPDENSWEDRTNIALDVRSALVKPGPTGRTHAHRNRAIWALHDGAGETYQDIADAFEITRERVRQIVIRQRREMFHVMRQDYGDHKPEPPPARAAWVRAPQQRLPQPPRGVVTPPQPGLVWVTKPNLQQRAAREVERSCRGIRPAPMACTAAGRGGISTEDPWTSTMKGRCQGCFRHDVTIEGGDPGSYYHSAHDAPNKHHPGSGECVSCPVQCGPIDADPCERCGGSGVDPSDFDEASDGTLFGVPCSACNQDER